MHSSVITSQKIIQKLFRFDSPGSLSDLCFRIKTKLSPENVAVTHHGIHRPSGEQLFMQEDGYMIHFHKAAHQFSQTHFNLELSKMFQLILILSCVFEQIMS